MIRLGSLLVQHAMLLGTVRLNLDDRGLVVLTGPPNSGKSSLCRAIRAGLEGALEGEIPPNVSVQEPDLRVEIEAEVAGQKVLATLNDEVPALADVAEFVVYDLDEAVFRSPQVMNLAVVEWAIGSDVWSRGSRNAQKMTDSIQRELERVRGKIAATRPLDLPRELEDRTTLKAELQQAIAQRELVDANIADHENAIRSATVRIQTAQREIDQMVEAEEGARKAQERQREREEILGQIAILESQIPPAALRPDFESDCRTVNRRLAEAQEAVDLPRRAAVVDGDCPACLRPMSDEERGSLRDRVADLERAVTLWSSRVELARWSSALVLRVVDLKRSVPPELPVPTGFNADRMAELRETVQRLTLERDEHQVLLDAVQGQVDAARARHEEAQRRWDLAQGSDKDDAALALEQAGWMRAEQELVRLSAAMDVARHRVFPSLNGARLRAGLEAINARLASWLPFPARMTIDRQVVDYQVSDFGGATISWSCVSSSMKKAAVLARHLALWDVACGAGVGPSTLVIDGGCPAIRDVVSRFVASVGLAGRTLVIVEGDSGGWNPDEWWTTTVEGGVASVHADLVTNLR